ncbi:MAG: hypothetical protein V4448_06845 [Pseudomonadota bacterium]
MNSLLQLSRLLADEEISANEVLASFTQLGFISGTENIERGLELAAMLNTRFRNLAIAMPTAITPLQRFINCERILQNLNTKKAASAALIQIDGSAHTTQTSRNIKTDYCELILSEDNLSENPAHVDKLDALALFWIFALLQDWNTEYSSLKAASPSSSSCAFFYECIQVFISTLSEEDTQANSTSLNFRISQFLQSELNCGVQSANKRVKKFLQYTAQPLSITDIKNSPDTKHTCTNDTEASYQRAQPAAVRQWNKLSERERLVAHHLAMPTGGLQRLCGVIRNTLQHPDGYAIEAFLAALAIATSKSISELLKVSIDPSEDESISLQNNKIYHVTSVVWKRNLSPPAPPLCLVLGEFFVSPIKNYLDKKSSRSISECLPPSEISWEERTYAWLKEKSGLGKITLAREIKYALLRELYRSGSNSAVTEWLTRPVGKNIESFRTRDALSFYLSYERNKVIHSQSVHVVHGQYGQAIKALFGAYARTLDANLFQKIASAVSLGRTTYPHLSVSSKFLQRIEQAKLDNNFVLYHNWFSAYCLLLLIISTGHRVSLSPFFFKWDLLLDDRLAFICDKAVVGSEARFVPLADTAVHQLEEYFRHLEAVKILMGRRAEQTESTFPDSPFFILSKDGKTKPISTDILQKQFLDDLGEDVKLRMKSFRSELTNVLWAKGIDGFDLEALLGHNRNLHVFGEASTWSVQEWADRVRPKINEYLIESKWIVLPAWKSVATSNRSRANLSCPEFAASTMGYEGRQRDAAQALARAREAVKSIFSLDYLSEQKWQLNEDDIKAVKENLAIQFSHDPAARDKTLSALHKEINRLDPFLESVNSPTINLQRTEVGPVDILSSRHFAIATAIRLGWTSAYGEDAKYSDPDKQCIAHLAHIGLSLVMFDAVLDVKQLKSFIRAIAEQSFYKIEDRLVVRTELELSSSRYQKALILSPSSTALVLGYTRHCPKINLEIAPKTIEGAMSDILIRILTRRVKSRWTFGDLVTVFKPWWFIRLPGCLYSIASGKYLGPSLDMKSEAAIFNGITTMNVVATNMKVATNRGLSIASHQDQSLAKRELSSLLQQARLRFEDGKGNSKQQRTRLKALLVAPLSAQLERLIEERQVVSLLFDFIDYLLVEGGKRTKDLRFGSIATYLTSILPELIHQGWDVDFLQFEESDYRIFYSNLKSTAKDKDSSTVDTVIALFHRFLQWQIDAPFVWGLGLGLSSPKRIRSAIITSEAFDQAFHQLRNTKDVDVFEAELACRLMTLTYGFGLRFKEAYGLTVNSINSESGPSIYVGINRFRAVKSKRPRLIDIHNLQNNQKNFLLAQIRTTSAANKEDPALFSDPTRANALYPTHRIAQLMTSALRNVTGGNTIVPHTMRHTYATCVAMAVLPTLAGKGHSELIYTKLASHIDREQLASPIKAGFAGWPFWMERVAMLMGHENVSTIFNTYWHTSHCAIADYTSREDQMNQISRQQLAQMMGVSAPAISQQFNRLESESTDSARTIPMVELVHHRLRNSSILSLADKIAESAPITPKVKGRPRKVTAADPRANNFAWQAIDRLLCERQLDGSSLDELVTVAANDFGIRKIEAQKIVDNYKSLFEMTGFADFEPQQSELAHSSIRVVTGTQRGSVERQRLISTAQQMCHEKPAFSATLASLCAAWTEHVDVKTPWIVAKSVIEANVFIQLLVDLGAQTDQLRLKVISFRPDDIKSLENLVLQKNILSDLKRVSKGAAHIKVSEIGINIAQVKNASLPDGRDLHRAIFLLALIFKCDASEWK